MKLSADEARVLLENERRPEVDPGWIIHATAVGDTAGEIARALHKKGFEIDPELVAAQGYLHDIGKRLGSFGFVTHMVDGYNYLKELGYDEKYASVCLTHSFIGNDPSCTISTQLDKEKDTFVINFVKNYDFTLGDRVVGLSDAMCLFRPMTVEQRLVDVISRHGTGPSTQRAFQAFTQLKHEIDEKLGYNLYDLFPEIRENL